MLVSLGRLVLILALLEGRPEHVLAPLAIDLAEAALLVVLVHVGELVVHVSEGVLLQLLGLLHVQHELQVHQVGQVAGFALGGQQLLF